MQDGMTWLLSSPEESLAYILADRGFDVWIANTRGTRWSSRHISLDSSSRVRLLTPDKNCRRYPYPFPFSSLKFLVVSYRQEYWDWSWDDLVVKDMPNMVDYVCTHTGQKPHFVGHSMVT
jgi:lysosomal acid lipase/cholesteryl ester hydrolase